MASFPSMTSGAVAKFPLTRAVTFRSGVLCSVDGTEQRFSKGNPLTNFTLVFTRVKTVDKNTIRDFFNARMGAFDHSWSLTLPPSVEGAPAIGAYNDLEFVPKQSFVATEENPGFWSFTLKVRQTLNGAM